MIAKDSSMRLCWVFWYVMIFCINFARWLQKIEATCDAIDRRQLTPILDKPAFSRIPQTLQPQFVVPNFRGFVKRQVCPKWGWVADDWMQCVGFSRMLWSFLTTLQDDSKDSSNMWYVLVFWDATIFCNNFARWLQKIVATSQCDVLGFLGCEYLL